MPISSFGRVLVAMLAAFSCTAVVHAETAAPDPFAKVPPLPTACYSQGETFYPKLDAAKEAVLADQYAQEAVNTQIREQFQSGDPMEKAARMQQWMMDNPEEAMAYMQGIQTAGEVEPAKAKADQMAEAKFETDRKALITNYQAAMKTLNAPMDAKFAAYDQRLVAIHGCGWYDGECGAGNSPEEQAEYNAIQKERDTAYAAACPGWWGPTGQFTTHMKRYKDWLTQQHVPYMVSLEVHLTNQYKIFNTPAASHRSIEPYRAASRYINAAYPIYQMRHEKPLCNPKFCE